MTLRELQARLGAADTDARLVFATGEGRIGPGYHVTEFKRAQVTGIDCGARVTTWTEAAMQLLDGDAGDRMAVGKFRSILGKSLAAVDGLADAPLRVEFANGNAGLRLYRVVGIETGEGEIVIGLGDDRVVCKPVQAFVSGANRETCCDSANPRQACCA